MASTVSGILETSAPNTPNNSKTARMKILVKNFVFMLTCMISLREWVYCQRESVYATRCGRPGWVATMIKTWQGRALRTYVRGVMGQVSGELVLVGIVTADLQNNLAEGGNQALHANELEQKESADNLPRHDPGWET